MNEYENKKSKLKIRLIGILLVIALIFIGGLIFLQKTEGLFTNEKVTVGYISGKLENISELTTQKLTCSGTYSIAKGEIPFITKKGFTMSYTAEIRAGIDFAKIESIEISKNAVLIKLPHARLQTVKIDPASIEFFDEKHALFNPSKKEDVSEAIADAEKELTENTDYSQLLTDAENYAEILIKAVLSDSIGKREIEIVFI